MLIIFDISCLDPQHYATQIDQIHQHPEILPLLKDNKTQIAYVGFIFPPIELSQDHCLKVKIKIRQARFANDLQLGNNIFFEVIVKNNDIVADNAANVAVVDADDYLKNLPQESDNGFFFLEFQKIITKYFIRQNILPPSREDILFITTSENYQTYSAEIALGLSKFNVITMHKSTTGKDFFELAVACIRNDLASIQQCQQRNLAIFYKRQDIKMDKPPEDENPWFIKFKLTKSTKPLHLSRGKKTNSHQDKQEKQKPGLRPRGK